MEPVILVRRFLRDTRAGATVIAAAALTVMTLGGAALITDHLWLVDQRDTLKSAADSASIAATLEMNRKLEADSAVSDEDLEEHLESVAKRYIEFNLSHLPVTRLARAKETLAVELTIDRAESRVAVVANADLGGMLVARALPLLGGYTGPEKVQATAAVECAGNAIEVVLALDVTASMHARIDQNLPAGGDNRRLNAVVKAAKALVQKLGATCDGRTIAMGVVPWDKTVRVPRPATWQQSNWVNMGTQPHGHHPDGLGGVRRGSRSRRESPGRDRARECDEHVARPPRVEPLPRFHLPGYPGLLGHPDGGQHQGSLPQSGGCNQERPGDKTRSVSRQRLGPAEPGGQLQLHLDGDTSAHHQPRHRGRHARRHQDEKSDGRRDHGASRSDVGAGACSPTPGAQCGAAASASIPSTLPTAG